MRALVNLSLPDSLTYMRGTLKRKKPERKNGEQIGFGFSELCAELHFDATVLQVKICFSRLIPEEEEFNCS